MPPETAAATDLVFHPDNPRQGDIGAIAESIATHGWFGVVIAQRTTGRILAGNHRVRAAIHLGMADIPVHWVDCDDDQARQILLADNRTSDLASYDNHHLATLLAEIHNTSGDLAGTGWDGDSLDALLSDINCGGPFPGELDGPNLCPMCGQERPTP